MNSILRRSDLTPAKEPPLDLSATGLGAPDREWTELRAALAHATLMIGSHPGECTRSTLRLGCQHLRIALNIAIRLGGEC